MGAYQEQVDLRKRHELVVGALAVRLYRGGEQHHTEREHRCHNDLHRRAWRNERDCGQTMNARKQGSAANSECSESWLGDALILVRNNFWPMSTASL